jgi:hypothetical protein
MPFYHCCLSCCPLSHTACCPCIVLFITATGMPPMYHCCTTASLIFPVQLPSLITLLLHHDCPLYHAAPSIIAQLGSHRLLHKLIQSWSTPLTKYISKHCCLRLLHCCNFWDWLGHTTQSSTVLKSDPELSS